MQIAGGHEDHEHRPKDEDRVYGITTAETSHTEDITRRQKQYILTMMIRVVSIVVVVSVPGISWPIKIGLCLVATVIPYIAVVRANGGPNPDKDPTNLMIGGPGRDALGSAQPGLPGGGGPDDYVQGDYVRTEYAAGEHAFDRASDIGHTNEPRVSQGSMIQDDAPADAPRPRGEVDQGSDQPVEPR